jgi:hypothetical protein
LGDGESNTSTDLLPLAGEVGLFLLELLVKEIDCELVALLVVPVSSSPFKNFTIEKTDG